MEQIRGLEISTWDQESYKPLVFSQGWQVAILNWDPYAEADAVEKVERHVLTDEVFVLLKGSGALVIAAPDGLRVVDVIQDTIYDVTIGTWHTVIGSRDSSWLIVENKDTHLGDTEYRPLSDQELESFWSQIPDWVRRD